MNGETLLALSCFQMLISLVWKALAGMSLDKSEVGNNVLQALPEYLPKHSLVAEPLEEYHGL